MHPFYLAIDNANQAHGGFLLNSNAMTALVGSNFVGFRTSGGIIDYYAFIGPEPEDVINQYHQLIGYPTLVPYWSLGWHQCRWGYKDLTTLKGIVNSYMTYNIPLDVIWSDIDYMNNFQDFTLDPINYPQAAFSSWVQSIQIIGKHWVPIVDAGIAVNPSYSTYTTGLQQEVYIKSAYVANSPTVGVVWPGQAVFVDWFNSASTSFWVNQLKSFESSIAFSGIWLDMNEASNFITGEYGHSPSIITNETMPFNPTEEDINTKSLDVASIHAGGIIEYNAHSLFGFMEAMATSQYFTQNLQTRPFVLSRSSFPGHGRFASKWTGDNFSS